MNGITYEVRYQKQLNTFRKGNSELGINASDPVPMNDDFIRKAEKAWFPEAPSKNLIEHSVENVPNKMIAKMNSSGAAAVTVPTQKAGLLTGNSSIYYNPNGAAFVNAKQLFYTMGHEFIHVSQYASLAGQSAKLITGSFIEVMELHAHGFESSVLGSRNNGGFTPAVIKDMMLQYPNYFKQLNYINFPWTTKTTYRYPFQ